MKFYQWTKETTKVKNCWYKIFFRQWQNCPTREELDEMMTRYAYYVPVHNLYGSAPVDHRDQETIVKYSRYVSLGPAFKEPR